MVGAKAAARNDDVDAKVKLQQADPVGIALESRRSLDIEDGWNSADALVQAKKRCAEK